MLELHMVHGIPLRTLLNNDERMHDRRVMPSADR